MAIANGSYTDLSVSGGTTMRAYVAQPDGPGPYPAIMVFQEAFGVNEHIRDVTRRFAGEGYVAIAPELFHRTGAGFEGSYGDFPAIQPHMQAMTIEGQIADIQATYEWLAKQPNVDAGKIASTGYCLGGSVSFLACSVVPLQASVSYYGGRIADLLDRAGSLHAPFLMFWGGLDKHIPPEKYRAAEDGLIAAGKAYTNVVISDADHGFFNDDKPQAYNERASKEAWALTLAFLKNNMG